MYDTSSSSAAVETDDGADCDCPSATLSAVGGLLLLGTAGNVDGAAPAGPQQGAPKG